MPRLQRSQLFLAVPNRPRQPYVPPLLPLGAAATDDVKGKLSIVLYVAAIPLAFVRPWMAHCLYALVALTWPVPDRRIEKGR